MLIEEQDGSVAQIAALAQKAQSANARVTVIDGVTYSTTPLHEVRPANQPRAAAITLSTLTGLRDYVLDNRDALDFGKHLVHVAAPDVVLLYGALHATERTRESVVQVKSPSRLAVPGALEFGRFYPVEAFNIFLAACFVPIYDHAAVVRVLGTVTADEIVTQKDDGISQRVVVENGLGAAHAVIPPFVELAPYRTFAEIEQPVSRFVLRMKKGGGDGVLAALFEADGGAWRNEAMLSIRDWLRVELPDEVAVLA